MNNNQSNNNQSRRLLGGALAAAALSLSAACGSASAASHGAVGPDGATLSRSTSQPATSIAARSTTPPSSPARPSTNPPTNPPTSAPTSQVSVSTGTAVPADAYAAARRVVRQHGFDPAGSAADWHGDHQLNAIGGVLSDSADGKFQRVFFFVNGRYIGLDSSEPSGSVQVANTGDDVATVTYGLFAPNDALCCPSSTRSVRFQWNGSALVPLDPIPPVATGTTTGR